MNCRRCGKELVFLRSGGGDTRTGKTIALHNDDSRLSKFWGGAEAFIDDKFYETYDIPARTQRDARIRLEDNHGPVGELITELVLPIEFDPSLVESEKLIGEAGNVLTQEDGRTVLDQELGLPSLGIGDGEVLSGALDNG